MTITYTAQWIGADGRDITPDFFAEDDAERMRFWEGDFCLLELRRVPGGWQPTGGDGDWVRLADRVFAEPYLALAELCESYATTAPSWSARIIGPDGEG